MTCTVDYDFYHAPSYSIETNNDPLVINDQTTLSTITLPITNDIFLTDSTHPYTNTVGGIDYSLWDTQTHTTTTPAEVEAIKPELPQPAVDDPVNHPSHYTYGTIETIDYIEDKGLNFNQGNAIKYVSRAGHKANTIEDLEKAVWYINREINRLKKVNQDDSGPAKT